MKQLNLIIKADVQGSVEAVKQALEKLMLDGLDNWDILVKAFNKRFSLDKFVMGTDFFDIATEVYDKEFAGRNRRYYKLTERGYAMLKMYDEEWRSYSRKVTYLFEGGSIND